MVKLYGSVLSCHQHMHAWRSSGEKQLGRSLHKREEMSAEKQSEGRGGFLAAVVVYLCFSGLFFQFLFLNASGK